MRERQPRGRAHGSRGVLRRGQERRRGARRGAQGGAHPARARGAPDPRARRDAAQGEVGEVTGTPQWWEVQRGEPAPHLPLPNAGAPLPGVLTGGQPDAATLREAARLGYRTLVNLRRAHEDADFERDRRLARELGLRWVHLPVARAEDLGPERARALLEAIAERPALVYCRSGDRVGALFAAAAHYHGGLAPADAIAFGHRASLGGLASLCATYFRARPRTDHGDDSQRSNAR
ncbi:MAG: hypothetical protein D6776_02520 [Planctomycetota bacterium]|nr:MAG: hypothetical protein D6776_02520 [Planctomycetota bacterium]